MDSLQKITEEIIRQANAEAEEILSLAKEKSDAIISKAESDAAEKFEEATHETDRQAQALFSARESAIELQRRQSLLDAKQIILRETLDKAKAAILAMPKKEYFVMCIKIAAPYAHEGTGEILLNAKDKPRLPADFDAQLLTMLPKEKKLRVSDQTADIDGGFLLKYGDVEENCSISAVLQERREELIDLIKGILF